MKQHWQKKLEQLGYTFDTNQQIWSRPEYQGIAYNDGDEVETRIANAIAGAQDISVLSPELRQHCIDWASLYHLTGARANLMRPFHHVFASGASVLEVGAGCGAITRYMGECGAKVLALEGTPRRAAIARSRTRDLANVTVLSERFSDFAPPADAQFDVITLIGVLEYANLFTPSSNPHLSMLQRVRQLLKPDGVLIIAIENQLGLKYFAGAPEDHIGQPMYGIEGRYQPNQPQTFGLVAMKALLQDAGFVQNQFMSPLPDYKLPTSIVTESGFANPQFDSSALAWQGARSDPQLPALTNFSLELTWPEVDKNGLALDMANSFLIAAMPTAGQQAVDASILAFHYSAGRLPMYCKQTQFVQQNDTIALHVSRMVAPHTGMVEGDLLNQHIDAEQPYARGELLSQRFVKLVTQDGWTLAQLKDYLQTWLGIVQKQAQGFGGDFYLAQATVNTVLPGECIDCVAQNIIWRGNDAPEFIDKEWTSTEPVNLGHLIFRQVIQLLNSVSRFGACANQHPMSRHDFVKHAYQSLSLEVTDQNLAIYNLHEAMIQQSVTGTSHEHCMDWQPQSHINYQRVHHQNAAILAQRDEQIANLGQALAERDGQITSMRTDVQAKQDEAEQLRRDISSRQASMNHLAHLVTAMQNSRSWRYTAALRKLGSLARPPVHLYRKLKEKAASPRVQPAVSSPEVSTDLKNRSASFEVLSGLGQKSPTLELKQDASTLIAFYLPQYHKVAENSEWWGPGFTEWTNVVKGKPNYDDHYQPHLPRELGFYDLSNVEVMREQAEMARLYGVGAFCFYYYWFSGRRILEKPIDNFLNSDIDMPYCLCWANENWTRTWDGDTRSVLMEQKYLDSDPQAFIESVLPHFRETRYLKVDGKPMLVVYRAKDIPNVSRVFQLWRDAVKSAGFPDLHIAAVDFYDIARPDEVGADALVEFPPHKFNGPNSVPDRLPTINNHEFRGNMVDYAKVMAQSANRPVPDFTLYRGVLPSWDNTARRQNTPTTLHGSTPELFREWLSYIRSYTRENVSGRSDNFIFINAWNEWGEGCHLEPDQKYGLQYLEAVKSSAWYEESSAGVNKARQTLIAKAADSIRVRDASDGQTTCTASIQQALESNTTTHGRAQRIAYRLRNYPIAFFIGKYIYKTYSFIWRR